jgi:hypothetical protein
MNKVQAKRWVFILMTPIILIGSLTVILMLSQILASFQEGADPASIFRGHQLVRPALEDARWLVSVAPQGRTPSDAQKEELLADYWQAWQALGRAYATGKRDDLSTYWAQPILNHLNATISFSDSISYETTAHKLRLLYFADDASVARISDGFIVRLNEQSWRTTAEITLTLDNGRWRIRLLEINYRGSVETS